MNKQQAAFLKGLNKHYASAVKKALDGRTLESISSREASAVIAQVLQIHPEGFWRKGSQRHVVAQHCLKHELDKEKTFEAIKADIGKKEALTWKFNPGGGRSREALPLSDQVERAKTTISDVIDKLNEILGDKGYKPEEHGNTEPEKEDDRHPWIRFIREAREYWADRRADGQVAETVGLRPAEHLRRRPRRRHAVRRDRETAGATADLTDLTA